MASERAKWVRIYTGDVLRDPISRDATLARTMLVCWLWDRSARDMLTPQEACEAVLDRPALHKITGSPRRPKQMRILYEFAEKEGILLEEIGEFVRVRWPNFLKFLPPARRPSGASRPDADADSDSDTDDDSDATQISYERRELDTAAEPISQRDAAESKPKGPLEFAPPGLDRAVADLWPHLGKNEVDTAVEAAWVHFSNSPEYGQNVGFVPFLREHWEEIPQLDRAPLPPEEGSS